MPAQPDVVHPRPQLARADWTDLSGPWGFAYDDARCGLDTGWMERDDVYTRTISVPFPPESPASGIGETGYHPVVWYRRTVRLSCPPDGTRVLLHCGAVDYRAQVWVNGHLAVAHEGGHTPFSADITAALRSDGEQSIVIRAEDAPLDLAQPRGKQDWQPGTHAIWYYRTTGIWQPVWLETVAAAHVERLRWTPDLDRRALGLEVAVAGASDRERTLRLRVRLSLGETALADDTYTLDGAELRREIALDALGGKIELRSLLWSPEHPTLIDAALTLYDGETVLDEVRSYAGLRSAGVAHGRFLLNGAPYYPRLALEQGYWPESHLAAPSAEALRREVELAKELGFNGVRIHQKVEDPRFLYWCDRLGLLVWGEMANAFVFSTTAVERLTREWLEVVARDYSHPCIVAWVPLNESWGVPNLTRDPAQRHYIQMLYHLTKALDPTRPAMDNEGWEHIATDVYGIHDYHWDGGVLRERYGSTEAVERTLYAEQPSGHAILLPGAQRTDEPVMLTEFGGVSFRPETGEQWFGYGAVADAENFIAKYRELLDAVLDSPTIAGFCYTQLTDTGQETNGLLTEHREPKVPLETIHAITTRKQARAR